MAINNPKLHQFIAKYIELCNPQKVIVCNGSPEDLENIRKLALENKEEAKLAANKGVFLEITSRKGHSYTNGHVAKMARETSAKLILNSDTHAPGDQMNEKLAANVIEGAGLPAGYLSTVLSNSRQMLEQIGYVF